MIIMKFIRIYLTVTIDNSPDSYLSYSKTEKRIDLKVVRLVESNCIDIKWNKVESGACIVKYDVKLRDASGKYYHNKSGYNIREMKICNVKDFANITNVEMMASFKNVTSKASNANIITQSQTSTGMIICSYRFAIRVTIFNSICKMTRIGFKFSMFVLLHI